MTTSGAKASVPSRLTHRLAGLRRGLMVLSVAAAGWLALAGAPGVWPGPSGMAQARDTVARESIERAPGIDSVRLSDLPPEALQTERLIRAGGPFPYAKDGTVFFNRERLLPRQARGHYREYTVPTPGARDRGARRMVCGGRQPREPEACFYTDDHYASFRQVAP